MCALLTPDQYAICLVCCRPRITQRPRHTLHESMAICCKGYIGCKQTGLLSWHTGGMPWTWSLSSCLLKPVSASSVNWQATSPCPTTWWVTELITNPAASQHVAPAPEVPARCTSYLPGCLDARGAGWCHGCQLHVAYFQHDRGFTPRTHPT